MTVLQGVATILAIMATLYQLRSLLALHAMETRSPIEIARSLHVAWAITILVQALFVFTFVDWGRVA